MNKEPRFLEVKRRGEVYEVRQIYVPREMPNIVKRIPYDSSVAYHVERCVKQANEIEQPGERQEFLERELEAMLG
ncbi:hypothetical protein KY345_06205 [Candidatus Woesearchaeota archaeon]|nr:hypothetical protein [Candidatus Woesearchaeota archaeon]